MVAVAGQVLLELVSAPTRVWLAERGQRRSFEDGALIHSRGEADMGMGIVIEGKVRLSQLRSDGSETFLSIVLPGQHFGDIPLFQGRKRTHDALAVGPTEIDHYDFDAFMALLDHPEIVRTLYRITAMRLGGTIVMNDDLRGLPRHVHLAKILLHQWRLYGEQPDIPCVQEDLAGILGVSTMTLSKCLAVLRKEGLIETGYRRITLTDPAALKAWLSRQSSF